jgi:hypothetical protein
MRVNTFAISILAYLSIFKYIEIWAQFFGSNKADYSYGNQEISGFLKKGHCIDRYFLN